MFVSCLRGQKKTKGHILKISVLVCQSEGVYDSIFYKLVSRIQIKMVKIRRRCEKVHVKTV